MKEVKNWDEKYIYNIPPGEHDWIEFKSSHLLDMSLPNANQGKILDELSKQISAFSNSGGGSIVYGIKDQEMERARTIDQGGITINCKGKNIKEWLEDVITNLVEFPLNKFNIYLILRSNNESAIESGKALIVIEIPDSNEAPHQAKDGKYYARVGGKSRPIGHRMIMDILARRKHPNVRLRFEIINQPIEPYTKLKYILFNEGNVIANNVIGFIYLPMPVDINSELFEKDGENFHRVIIKNIHKDLVNLKPGNLAFSSSGFNSSEPTPLYMTRISPILPKLGFIQTLGLIGNDELFKRFLKKKITWQVYADEAPMTEGEVLFEDIYQTRVSNF